MAEKTWQLDKAHSTMEFNVRHMMISTVRGHFEDFDADIKGDIDNVSSMNAKVTIDASSVNTANSDRDKHLKSDDLFSSGKHPQIVFQSKKTSVKGEDLEIVGDLTIRDVTKEVTLKGEYGGKILDPYGNERFGLTASTTINRQDFGMKWNMILEGGGLMVGDKVTLNVALEAFAPAN